jgi:hypothetical protein
MFLNRDELWKVLPVVEESWKHQSGSAICIHRSHNSVSFLWCKDHSLSNQGHCSCNYGLKAAITCGVVIFREQGHLKVEFGTLDGKFILGRVHFTEGLAVLSNCSESSLFKWSLMILETWLRLTIL